MIHENIANGGVGKAFQKATEYYQNEPPPQIPNDETLRKIFNDKYPDPLKVDNEILIIPDNVKI